MCIQIEKENKHEHYSQNTFVYDSKTANDPGKEFSTVKQACSQRRENAFLYDSMRPDSYWNIKARIYRTDRAINVIDKNESIVVYCSDVLLEDVQFQPIA